MIKSLLSKLLTLFIFIRYPQIDSKRRYFIRFFYLGHLNQIKFLYKDLIKKPIYKEITFFGEFQQELLYVLPYAYWHYLNGTLKKTISCEFTSELYFFSPEHEERFKKRNYLGNYKFEIPHGPHSIVVSKLRWERVPIKEEYKNEIFIYQKPILIIANRYNSEWGNTPISYLSLEILQKIIELLKSKYQIIYNRPNQNKITNDNSEILELNDKSFLKSRFPEVIFMDDLYSEYNEKVNNYNHLQLLVYSNAKKFISVHGGTSALASYFGGENIIYSKNGHEHELNEFVAVFPQLSGTKITVCRNYDDLMKRINDFKMG